MLVTPHFRTAPRLALPKKKHLRTDRRNICAQIENICAQIENICAQIENICAQIENICAQTPARAKKKCTDMNA